MSDEMRAYYAARRAAQHVPAHRKTGVVLRKESGVVMHKPQHRA